MLAFFLQLQITFQPSSSRFLNRADTHALLALVVGLNVALPFVHLAEEGDGEQWDKWTAVGVVFIALQVSWYGMVGAGTGDGCAVPGRGVGNMRSTSFSHIVPRVST